MRELEILGHRTDPRYLKQLKISFQSQVTKTRQKEIEDQFCESYDGDELYCVDESVANEDKEEDEEVPF